MRLIKNWNNIEKIPNDYVKTLIVFGKITNRLWGKISDDFGKIPNDLGKISNDFLIN